ncbi:MAG: DUF885 family protein [Actinomycetales bacterium]|nr:DUF885 family protein [Actinomycetales bacterium]
MSVTDAFHALAEGIVDDLLRADPETATSLGEHRFDDRLADLSSPGVTALLTTIDDRLTELDGVDDLELELADQVDLEIVRARLLRTQFEWGEVRRHEWDPMVWNPGTALYLLLSRDFAPLDERAAALRGRLSAIPDHLATGRLTLGEMSAIHVDTAVEQLAGTAALIDGQARAVAGDDPVVDAALAATREFASWLDERRAGAIRDPRLGPALYAGALWHALDEHISPDELLDKAKQHLAGVAEQLAETAQQYLGASLEGRSKSDLIREALADVAAAAPVTDASVLSLIQAALDRTTSFVGERDLVSLSDLDVRVIEMPEIHRGVAVAYCDAPGPLERGDVVTYVAVAPTPATWDPERVASFYREYNGVQLHDLTVHEAMPGHVVQLAHAQRLHSPTRVRRFGRSGVFVEGWAVYAEELMVERGYSPDGSDRGALALRVQQLKMQMRSTINTILDIGVHAHGLPEDEGMWLMREVAFQEEGEAAGKWRRAILTAGQLPTYFAGYLAVSDIVDDLRVMHGEWSDRQVHDLVLGQGSPSPRHLRSLLGI